MAIKDDILLQIKKTVKEVNPDAVVILFGSQARGVVNENSDFDILILLDKEKITRDDEKNVKYPLYDIEYETGKIISPLVLSKKEWEQKHKITPFYSNIVNEGILL
jgi:uncharacterized protein